MSGVRQVVETFDIPLHPRKAFSANLPAHLLRHEPHKLRAVDFWERVREAIHFACKQRNAYKVLKNKQMKETVFQAVLVNICKEFNGRTENLKVEFQRNEEPLQDEGIINKKRRRRSTGTVYNLRLSRLSNVSAMVRRNIYESCVAEIPFREIETQAELVENVGEERQSESSSAVVTEIIVQDGDFFLSGHSTAQEITNYDTTNTTDDPAVMAATILPASASVLLEASEPLAMRIPAAETGSSFAPVTTSTTTEILCDPMVVVAQATALSDNYY